MKPLDALVFDLDGTLWDAAAASTEGWNLALAELSLVPRITVDDIRSVSGTPFAHCVEILLPELSPPVESTLRLFEGHERAVIERMGGVLYDGVADGLRRLAAVYPLFLVSNCPDWYLEAFLRVSGLGECFIAWDCHGVSGIPKSGMLLNLAARYRLEHAVYVGDTRGDREATEAAGMEFAFARYGFGSIEQAEVGAESTRAIPSFDSFGELVEFFLAERV